VGTHTQPLVTHLCCVQDQHLGTDKPKVLIHHIPSFTKYFQKIHTVIKEGYVLLSSAVELLKNVRLMTPAACNSSTLPYCVYSPFSQTLNCVYSPFSQTLNCVQSVFTNSEFCVQSVLTYSELCVQSVLTYSEVCVQSVLTDPEFCVQSVLTDSEFCVHSVLTDSELCVQSVLTDSFLTELLKKLVVLRCRNLSIFRTLICQSSEH
jgi:hypothetical protein